MSSQEGNGLTVHDLSTLNFSNFRSAESSQLVNVPNPGLNQFYGFSNARNKSNFLCLASFGREVGGPIQKAVLAGPMCVHSVLQFQKSNGTDFGPALKNKFYIRWHVLRSFPVQIKGNNYYTLSCLAISVETVSDGLYLLPLKPA